MSLNNTSVPFVPFVANIGLPPLRFQKNMKKNIQSDANFANHKKTSNAKTAANSA
jgi:hypothetical protein